MSGTSSVCLLYFLFDLFVFFRVVIARRKMRWRVGGSELDPRLPRWVISCLKDTRCFLCISWWFIANWEKWRRSWWIQSNTIVPAAVPAAAVSVSAVVGFFFLICCSPLNNQQGRHKEITVGGLIRGIIDDAGSINKSVARMQLPGMKEGGGGRRAEGREREKEGSKEKFVGTQRNSKKKKEEKQKEKKWKEKKETRRIEPTLAWRR